MITPDIEMYQFNTQLATKDLKIKPKMDRTIRARGTWDNNDLDDKRGFVAADARASKFDLVWELPEERLVKQVLMKKRGDYHKQYIRKIYVSTSNDGKTWTDYPRNPIVVNQMERDKKEMLKAAQLDPAPLAKFVKVTIKRGDYVDRIAGRMDLALGLTDEGKFDPYKW